MTACAWPACPSSGASGASSISRSTSRRPRGSKWCMRLAEMADVVHHNMTKGTAARLGIDYESLTGSQPRARALQHLRLRRRGTAVGIRRARPALSGRLRARVRGRARGRGQPALVPALRHDRHRQRHGVGRRGARRPVPPTPYRRGTGPLDVAAQRRGGVRLRRLPGGGGTGPGSPGPRPQPDRRLPVLPACTRPSRVGSRWLRSGRANGPSCAASSAGRTSSAYDTFGGADRGPRRDRAGPRASLSRRGPPWPGSTTWPRPAWRARSRSTPTTARPCSTTPTTSASAWSPNTPIRSWGRCASSAP